MPAFKRSGEVYSVSLHPGNPNKPVSYINLTIHDASAAVRSLVQQKVSESRHLPGSALFKSRFAEKVANMAANNVPLSTIAAKLGQKLPKLLMYQLYHKVGMRLAAQTVFVEDCYIVLQFQVQHVDTTKLMSKLAENSEHDDDDSVATEVVDAWIDVQQNKLLASVQLHQDSNNNEGEDDDEDEGDTTLREIAEIENSQQQESGWKFSAKKCLVSCLERAIMMILPSRTRQMLEEERLPAIVQKKISQQITVILEKKLAKKSMEADAVVLNGTEQARYFFTNLQEVRERRELKKNK